MRVVCFFCKHPVSVIVCEPVNVSRTANTVTETKKVYRCNDCTDRQKEKAQWERSRKSQVIA